MTRKPLSSSDGSFAAATATTNVRHLSNASGFGGADPQRVGHEIDKHLRRVPVPQRAEADYAGETMARYINGLEARMVEHMRKHVTHWQNNETRKILRRWSMPGANHPAPSWATPRDVLAEARDYAATLLRQRLASRMGKLGDIRIARYLGGHGEVDPLHLIFHNRSTRLDLKNKQKI